MKRIVSVLLALAVLAALVIVTTTSKHGVRAVYAQSGCSNATVNGNYPFLYAGFGPLGKSAKGNEAPLDALGVLAFDGVGNVSTSYTVVFNGAGAGVVKTDTGTYTVNSDCTGSMSFTAGTPSFNVVILGGGTEVFGLDTSPGDTATFDAKKQ